MTDQEHVKHIRVAFEHGFDIEDSPDRLYRVIVKLKDGSHRPTVSYVTAKELERLKQVSFEQDSAIAKTVIIEEFWYVDTEHKSCG